MEVAITTGLIRPDVGRREGAIARGGQWALVHVAVSEEGDECQSVFLSGEGDMNQSVLLQWVIGH